MEDPDLFQREDNPLVTEEAVGGKQDLSMVCPYAPVALLPCQVGGEIIRNKAQIKLRDLEIRMVRACHLHGNIHFSLPFHVGKEFRRIDYFQSVPFYALKLKIKNHFSPCFSFFHDEFYCFFMIYFVIFQTYKFMFIICGKFPSPPEFFRLPDMTSAGIRSI